MSRNLFRRWGTSLDDDAFAQAVAAAALVGGDPWRGPVPMDEAQVEDIGRHMMEFVRLSLNTLAKFVDRLSEGASKPVPDAGAYALLWQRLVRAWNAHTRAYEPLRIEIDPTLDPERRPWALDLLWLIRALARPAVGAIAVYVRADDPDRAVTWEWPVRIGLLGDDESEALKSSLADTPYSELWRIVDAESAATECNVLLLPSSVRGALAAVLGSTKKLHADCVIVLGGLKASTERALPLLAALRSEVETAGVVVSFTPPAQRRIWFESLVTELAHNQSLDVAVWQAAHAGSSDPLTRPPLVVASHRLMSGARLAEFARRFSDRLKHMAEPPSAGAERATATGEELILLAPPQLPPTVSLKEVGEELGRNLERFRYSAETGDATRLARMKQWVEARHGEPIRVERMSAVRAPTPQREPDLRHVTADVYDVTEAGQEPSEVHALRANRAYEASIGIELPREGQIVANVAFPAEKLSTSLSGHRLTVAFVPLITDASGRRLEPQVGIVDLPPTGPSTRCPFPFDTLRTTGEFRARILISHENRVLQTLMFSAAVDTHAGEITLEVENLVTAGFQNLEYRERFDAAIVVNHSATGQPGFTAIAGQQVSFREPEGIGDIIDEIKTLVSGEAVLPEKRSALKNPELERLLWKLANYGNALWDIVPRTVRDPFEKANRVQVVEARAGAFLPVEFFYDGRAPDDSARLCENAAKALADAQVHRQCPHYDDTKRICPARFWGFNRVIERQPAGSLGSNGDYALSVPDPDRSRLHILKSALVGASSRVRKEDLTGRSGIVAALKRVTPKVSTAQDWNDWVAEIRANSPSLLVLLPHSLADPELPKMSALEIGHVSLRWVKLEEEYVIGPASEPPVVLLLGCSTQLTDIPFMNFVQRFKAKRAALVLGTLASIKGRRTVGFVRELVLALASQAGTGERTFGDAFLAVKRRLLAKGDSFVLSLVAYGDVGWRL